MLISCMDLPYESFCVIEVNLRWKAEKVIREICNFALNFLVVRTRTYGDMS